MIGDLHAAVSGPADAPVVVLLHPMGHSAAIWEPHQVMLSEQFRMIAPDLPGHGTSAGPFTVSGSVQGLNAMIARVAPGAQVHLVGLSLGARVALSYAAVYPVTSLALLGCHLSPNISVQRFVMRLLPGRFFAADAGKQTVLASMDQVTAVDLRPHMARVTAPTLVVIGEKERSYLADARELADGIAGAELRTIAGASHLWPTGRVAEFAGMITEWVAKASASG